MDYKKKDWTGDKNSIFKTLGASNHTDKEREPDDFYATHPKAIDALIAYKDLCLPKHIWEPSCGTGCLSKRLQEKGFDVCSSDLIDRGFGVGGTNFFDQTELPDERIMCILTNPPYKFATDYAVHALSLLPENGYLCLFLKTTFAEGKERYRRLFAFTPPFWFYNSWSEYCVPRTESLATWKTTAAAQSVTPGGCGKKAIKGAPPSTGCPQLLIMSRPIESNINRKKNMELKKLVSECIEALNEEAGKDYSYCDDDVPFGVTINTNDGYIYLHYVKGNVEAIVCHDYEGDTSHPRYGTNSTNLEKFLEESLHDCVGWDALIEQWKEYSMDEYQRNGFRDEADFWHWKEGI